MLSRLCPPKLSYASITRIVLAAMLLLALLASVVPLNSFSAAQKTCTMECCAGKPPHLAGSCSAAFSGEHSAESNGDALVEDQAHTVATEMPGASPEIVEATSHCGTAEHSPKEDATAKDATSRRASRPPARVIAHALTTPCSPECAAAWIAAFAQVRRPRDAAALTARSRPRPPSHASLAEHISKLQSSVAATGRQSSPRAPPLFL